jgi:sugar lactone lactonase YvrE
MSFTHRTVPMAPCGLGEGPVWDEERNRFLWVDITCGQVCWYDPASCRTGSWPAPRWISALVPCRDGRFIAFAYHSYYVLDPKTGHFDLLGTLEGLEADVRFNDCKADRAGRIWAGTMSMDNREGAGRLFRLDHDWAAVTVLGDISISNGLDWSLDGRTMYYIDSLTREIRAYDFDEATGTLSGERTVVRIPEGEGLPDGMTVDSEGLLWAAQWGGRRVSCWNPVTGERVRSVHLPAERISSCAFGGEGFTTLFVTSAREGEQGITADTDGASFLVDTGASGRKPYRSRLDCPIPRRR